MNSFLLLGRVGVWQIFLISIILLVFILPILMLLFYKRNEPEHDLPVIAKLLLIINSLSGIGIILSLYILFRKKNYNGIRMHKFNKSMHVYAYIMLIISTLTVIYRLMQ